MNKIKLLLSLLFIIFPMIAMYPEKDVRHFSYSTQEETGSSGCYGFLAFLCCLFNEKTAMPALMVDIDESEHPISLGIGSITKP